MSKLILGLNEHISQPNTNAAKRLMNVKGNLLTWDNICDDVANNVSDEVVDDIIEEYDALEHEE